MIGVILTGAVGAIMNRVLGGKLEQAPNTDFWNKMRDIGGTSLCMVVFFLVMLVWQGVQTGTTEEGAAVYRIGSLGLFTALGATLGMYAGSTIGWGRYIGAIIGNLNKPFTEWEPIDRATSYILTRWLKSGVNQKYMGKHDDGVTDKIFYRPVKTLRLMGVIALSLRGAFWGLCITASVLLLTLVSHAIWGTGVTFSVAPVFGGMMMGSVYFLSVEIQRKIQGNANEGWPLGEWLFGAVLWTACTMI